MICHLCHRNNSTRLFEAQNKHGRQVLGRQRFNIYRCLDCGIIFSDVTVDDAYYEKFYALDYYQDISEKQSFFNFFFDKFKRFCFSRRLRLIKKYCPAAETILEIGCGKGEFLHFLPSSFKKYGIEVNRQALEFVKENYKDIELFKGGLDALRQTVGFDVIGLWHVLEHAHDPDGTLENIRKILKPTGIVVLEVPNSDSFGFYLTRQNWYHLDAPRHLFFYNSKVLEELAKRHGLKVICFKANPFDYFQDLPFSFFDKLKSNNTFFNKSLLIILFSVFLPIRILMALFWPLCAEINTYVLSHADA